MQIIAKRSFISTRSNIGNVPEGRILDISDDYANSLILAGLADKYIPSPVFSAKPTSFFLTKKEKASGSLSPAVQALPPKTVPKSKRGGRPRKTGA